MTWSTVLVDPPWRTHSGRLRGRRGFVDSYTAPMGGGLGESFGITTEFLLFARRGRAPMRNRTTGTWHPWPRRYVDGHPAHSKKPEGAYALIEHASHAPFIELFSREDQPRLGWSYWGNEAFGAGPRRLG